MPPVSEEGMPELKRQSHAIAKIIEEMRAVDENDQPSTHDPRGFLNPQLQQHYGMLQSIALDEKAPEVIKDYSIPDYNWMKNGKKGEKSLYSRFAEVRRMVYPDTYRGKRKGDGDAADGKRPKVDVSGI
eukprot:gene35970-62459_t